MRFWFWKSHAPTTSKNLLPSNYSLHYTEFFAIIKNCDYLADTKSTSALKSPQSMGKFAFYVWVPKTLQSFVEGQIYSQYPTVQIHQADEDYTEHERDHEVAYSTELTLTTDEFLPIRTFQNFEVDPLAGITGTLAKIGNHR